MSDLKTKYLQLLTMELDDLNSDLDMLVNSYTKEKADNKISNYVFMENLALLKNEITGLHLFHKIINETEIEHFGSLDELTCYIRTQFSSKMHEYGIAAALHRFVDKKLDKVEKFIKE